ncbi:ATP-dependent DNA ligase [Vararia minispora EC-137]|uniref:ATP-dependent DNA ligase n=1 Tax=Vararia minispora EC-137 TaxID=1314806 RepID=A0ACB8QM73_9AGAM|nr:ATP-dependent DNA ligase [Vararia minispora EC-137]
MPKRPTTAAFSPSSPRKKRREDASQGTLHSFFGAQQHTNPSQSVAGSSGSPAISASDKPLASSSSLAGDRSDASSPSTLTLPTSFHKAYFPLPTQRPNLPVEIIDVDALDDDIISPLSAPPKSPHPPAEDMKDSSPQRAQKISADYPNLSVDPLFFNVVDSPWGPSGSAPYSFLAHTLSSLSETRSRILILNILTNTLRVLLRHHPASLLPALYLLSNSLSPPYLPVELGLGPSTIAKCIHSVSGISHTALRKLYTSTGDAGDVAFEAKSKVRTLIPHPPLLISSLYSSLLKIASAKGQGAQRERQRIVESLLVSAKGQEVRFLVRTLSQHIRVGAVRTSTLTALARALVLTPPSGVDKAVLDPLLHLDPSKTRLVKRPSASSSSKKATQTHIMHEDLIDRFSRAEALIKRVFVQHPNYDDIVDAILKGGMNKLGERVPLTVGIPLRPTLGSPMRSLDEVYERVQDVPFSAEFKYDGQRAQVHAWRTDGNVTVKMFSRHLENMTDKYPDVVLLFERVLTDAPEISSFIIDAEIVAIDPDSDTLRSFQELSNRSRKDVKLNEIQVPVAVYVFDLMYLNGNVLLGDTFRHRRAALHKHFAPVELDVKNAARLRHVEYCESTEGKEATEEFWLKSVDSRCEGLMIKLLDNGEIAETVEGIEGKTKKKPLPATYEPDKRTFSWLKLKKDYVMTLGDTLDLIPIGAWHGNGRKAQWWSPVLLALQDPETGVLLALCKCMSGFSDKFYKDMVARYSEDSGNCSRRPLWGDVDVGGHVYFRPHEVWEIRGADITLSPVAAAARGIVSEDRGLSLRFPRFVKAREDKNISSASTPDFLISMWKRQQDAGKYASGPSADDGELIDAASSAEEEEAGSGDDILE